MVVWDITVTDVSTGRGVPNAKVYLFKDGGPVEPPENAMIIDITDETGAARFYVAEGFYRVGIIAKGYVIADPTDPRAPLEAWKDIWTCWGAGGAGYAYDFPVKRVKPEVNLAVAIGLPLLAIAIDIAAYAYGRKKGYI